MAGVITGIGDFTIFNFFFPSSLYMDMDIKINMYVMSREEIILFLS